MRKTLHDFDPRPGTAATGFFRFFRFFLCSLVWMVGGILPVGAQAVPESDAAPQPGRALFLLQRTGGPLPLSLRLEVEAAAERSALWIRQRIQHDFRPDPGEFRAAFRALLAMTREDSAPPGLRSPSPPGGEAHWLQSLAGDDSAHSPERRLMLEVLRNPESAAPSERELGEFDAQLQQTARELLQHEDRTLALRAVKKLLDLQDTAAMAGLDPWKRIADRAMRGEIFAKLEELLRETPPTRPGRRAEFYAGIAAATLLLPESLSAPGSKRSRTPASSSTLVSGWEFLAKPSLLTFPEESWLLVRALNRTAPNLLIDENSSPPRSLDWRSACARQLLQSQDIIPSDGSGYWSRPDGEFERKAPPMADFIATAYAFLILIQL